MRRRESHDDPSVVQEPVYDPVSVSGTRPGDAVEMKSNVAYGTTGLGGANITYETVPQRKVSPNFLIKLLFLF